MSVYSLKLYTKWHALYVHSSGRVFLALIELLKRIHTPKAQECLLYKKSDVVLTIRIQGGKSCSVLEAAQSVGNTKSGFKSGQAGTKANHAQSSGAASGLSPVTWGS